MSINNFIALLEAEFHEVKEGTLLPQTNFREIEEWSSMHALIVIALVDLEYEITLKGENLIKMETIQDLWDFTQENKK